jgi:hypothetical protein
MAKRTDDVVYENRITLDHRDYDPSRLEQRIHDLEIREVYKMASDDPLFVPPERIPMGWEYSWIRTHTLDVPDFTREVQTRKLGFTPVPADRHPDMCIDDRYVTSQKNNFISYRGLLLCEIPKIIMDKRRAAQAQHNELVTNSLQGLNSMMSDPHMPKRDFGSSTATRTVSFAD